MEQSGGPGHVGDSPFDAPAGVGQLGDKWKVWAKPGATRDLPHWRAESIVERVSDPDGKLLQDGKHERDTDSYGNLPASVKRRRTEERLV